MHKSERQKTILNVISATRIGSQTDLVKLLRKNGFTVTQASISRDLAELGIVKINGRYVIPKRTKSTNPFGLVSLETSGQSLIVARCGSGLASAAAVRIDAAGIDEVVGTIAGDDTVFIAVRDSKNLRPVIKTVWELFE